MKFNQHRFLAVVHPAAAAPSLAAGRPPRRAVRGAVLMMGGGVVGLDGCDRLFSVHLFRTLPVGYILRCLLVFVL